MPRSRSKELNCKQCGGFFRVSWQGQEFIDYCPACGAYLNAFDVLKDSSSEDWKTPNSKKHFIGKVNIFSHYLKSPTYDRLENLLPRLPALKRVKWSSLKKQLPNFSFHTKCRLEQHVRFYCNNIGQGWIEGEYLVAPNGKIDPLSEENTVKFKEGLSLHKSFCERLSPPPIQAKLVSGELHFKNEYLAVIAEALENSDADCFIWDCENILEEPSMPLVDLFEYYKRLIGTDNTATEGVLNFNYVGGLVDIELQLNEKETGFSKEVFKASCGKKPNVYIGYDSTHKGLEDLCEFGIARLRKNTAPDIKILNHKKIDEYTRPYENQSTEFTYSRFLVPYLENYEGYSIFMDDDILLNHSDIYSFFMHLNPNDAVAVLKYPSFEASDFKFAGEKNVSYDRKLWSSLMVFNNSHPDCKKLTPEYVNTASGQDLHRFAWTDKISNIPTKYILTDGYDSYIDKRHNLGIHYTRGGPWIEGQVTRGMNLSLYEKLYEDYKKAGRWLYNPKK